MNDDDGDKEYSLDYEHLMHPASYVSSLFLTHDDSSSSLLLFVVPLAKPIFLARKIARMSRNWIRHHSFAKVLLLRILQVVWEPV